MRTIIFFILMSCALPSFATKDKLSQKQNKCCHVCRISKNCHRATPKKYVSCPQCSMTYCNDCIKMDSDFAPSEDGCLKCQNLCCCNAEEICEKDHKCCYTKRRTEQRHANNPEMTSYKKAGKKREFIEITCEENEILEPEPEFDSIIEIEEDDNLHEITVGYPQQIHHHPGHYQYPFCNYPVEQVQPLEIIIIDSMSDPLLELEISAANALLHLNY